MRLDHSVKKAEIIQVIKTTTAIGQGVEGDPFRELVQYWDFEGSEIAYHDHWKEAQDLKGITE